MTVTLSGPPKLASMGPKSPVGQKVGQKSDALKNHQT